MQQDENIQKSIFYLTDPLYGFSVNPTCYQAYFLTLTNESVLGVATLMACCILKTSMITLQRSTSITIYGLNKRLKLLHFFK